MPVVRRAGSRGSSASKHRRSGRVRASRRRADPIGPSLLATIGLSMLVAGCASWGVEPFSSRNAESGASRTDHITYVAGWDWGRASPLVAEAGHEAAAGWQTRNDLGYRVRVTRGYLVSHSAQLTACKEDGEEGALRLLSPGLAHAGHGEDYGPTAVLTSSVESLWRPEPMRWARIVVRAPLERRYCEAFYLVAMAGPMAAGLPEDVDMLGTSVHIEGRFARADASEPEGESRAFTLRTDLANGTIVDLVDALETVPPPSADDPKPEAPKRHVEVQILRDLGALFDGIDFDAMDEEARADALIRAVIGATRIEVGFR